MKITNVETFRNKEPIPLPIPWRAAWCEPSGQHVTSFGFSFYKVHTDEGIVGIGPCTGHTDPSILEGSDPFKVEAFWDTYMSGKRDDPLARRGAGLEIALWDIIGKAVQKPVYQLLGAYRDKLPVYAATSRLLTTEEHIDQVQHIISIGFKAVKLRMHRPDPWADLAVIQAVRRAVGDQIEILVDANQNNKSEGYNYWSHDASLQIAKELDQLDVYFFEEPRPRDDVHGLAEIAAAVNMHIAGGEHSPTVYDFREHLIQGAYDVLQPDVLLMGNMGITGLKKVSIAADYFGKLVIPHVCGNGSFPLGLAATLQAMATVANCPMVEYPYDPPILAPDTTQTILKEPLWIDSDGCVAVPSKPGIGIELDEEGLKGRAVAV